MGRWCSNAKIHKHREEFDVKAFPSVGLIKRWIKPVYVQAETLFWTKNIIMQIVILKYTLRLEYLFS